nr:hypothetical protein [Mycoplasma haemofelis]
MTVMDFSSISEDLIKRLDSLIPDWKSKINEEQFQSALKEGQLDEFWLLNRLRDATRADTYRKISDKGKEFTTNKDSSLDKSLFDSFVSVGAAIQVHLEELLNIESEIAKIIQECSDSWKERGFEHDKNSLNRFFDQAKKDLSEQSKAYNAAIDHTSNVMVSRVWELDSSKAESVSSIIRYNMQRFKDENSRLVSIQSEFVDSLQKTVMSRVDSLEGGNRTSSSIRNLQLAKEELLQLKEQLEGIASSEIENQKRLRKEFVSSVVDTPFAIKELWDTWKSALGHGSREDLFKEERDKGFIGEMKGEFRSLMKDCLKSFVKGASSFTLERYVIPSVKEKIKEWQEEGDRLYDNDLYKGCNYAWWVHPLTFGFCTGATLATNAIALARGNVIDLRGILFCCEFVTMVGAVPIGATFGTLMKSFTTHFFKSTIKSYLRSMVCDTVAEKIFSN